MRTYLKERLSNSWFFPRYIGIIYIERVMYEVKSYVRGRMLDIGCGRRRYESIFKEVVDSYIGLDWPMMEDRALPDIICDAMCIPVQTASVDVVLATELMEHLPSPHNFLIEVSRVLQEDGVLILSVPFMEPIHEEPRDYYRFTPFSLRQLMQEHGFAVRKLWKKGGWWSVVLGSFVNQSLYDWATSAEATGRRKYSFLAYLVLPACALMQWLAYQLDRVFDSQKYTLGYTLLAIRESVPSPEQPLLS
jgi:SAM-dependent methyltransferase